MVALTLVWVVVVVAVFSHILLQIFLSNLVFLTRSRFQILGQTQVGVFPISSQSHIKESCHDSRTSHDIDMELRPVTKLDKKNKTTSKKIDDDVMSVNCDFIVNFPIFV